MCLHIKALMLTCRQMGRVLLADDGPAGDTVIIMSLLASCLVKDELIKCFRFSSNLKTHAKTGEESVVVFFFFYYYCLNLFDINKEVHTAGCNSQSGPSAAVHLRFIQ